MRPFTPIQKKRHFFYISPNRGMILGEMNVRYCHILSVIVLVSFLYGNDGFESDNKNMYESKLIMKSLEEALQYLKNQPEFVTGDIILGVLITRANLQWIYGRLKYSPGSSSWLDRRLDQILNLCHDLFNSSKFKNHGLLRASIWENAAQNLKHGFLNDHEDGFQLPEFESCKSIDAYFMRGTPENSDFCINELLNCNCQVSEYCWLSEINGDSHSGYKTSHRLLYFQAAVKMKCEEINPLKFLVAKAIKNKLCQQMLLEAVALFQRPTLSVTRDLFMEQIGLCGLEGFEEFAPENWRNKVRSWQSYNGCFSLGMDFENCSGVPPQKTYNKTEIKRNDSVTDGCHTHVTAVAISALAFFLRVTLKLALNLN